MNKITFGDNIKMEVVGGSHDDEMRLTLRHFPKDVKVDFCALQKFLDRRKPKVEYCGTSRVEEDIPHFLSGLDENNVTTGEDIVAIIENQNVKSSDYDFDDTPRPSHADYVSHEKFGYAMPGGGMFSGRVTVMYVIAGFFAKTYLENNGIKVHSFVKSIGSVERAGYDVNKPESFNYFDDISAEMLDEIKRAKDDDNSVGGVIEGIIEGLPVGLGNAGFDGLESKISGAIFGIPAVKAVEFGSGFNITKKRGSIANDEFIIENDKIKTISNNNGGINGGISNGMPIVVNVGIKPTPSIGKPERTVSLSRRENVTLEISGRHDACIAVRAGVIIESMLALTILDELLCDDSLLSLRLKIDNIDDNILELLEKRFELSKEIGKSKKLENKPIEDKSREREIIDRLSNGSIGEEDIEKIYNVIFDISKRMQK